MHGHSDHSSYFIDQNDSANEPELKQPYFDISLGDPEDKLDHEYTNLNRMALQIKAHKFLLYFPYD